MKILDIIDYIGHFENASRHQVIKSIVNTTLELTWRFIILLVIVYFGRKIINFILDKLQLFAEETHDSSTKQFSRSVVKLLLYLLLFLIVLLILGFNRHSILMLISAMSLGIGIALKDFLSNIAGGIVIMFTKPFDIGQYIEVQGTFGKVVRITVFATYIDRLDSKQVVIPNDIILTNQVINQDANDYRLMEVTVPIGYDSDFKKALCALENLCQTFPGIEHDRKNFVSVLEYGNSTLNILVLAWTKNEGYYHTRGRFLTEILTLMKKENISMPFTTFDVNITGNLKDIIPPMPTKQDNGGTQ